MPPRQGLAGIDVSLPFSADPLHHVFIVIHGAGDPYVHQQPWLSSLENCLARLHNNYKLVASDLEKVTHPHSPNPKLPTALFLPVEWHRSAFHTWQQEVRCGDPRPPATTASPSSAPTVRNAMSETLGDLIILSSPFWRRTIAEHIATQIQSQLAAVRRNRPAFTGRVSLLAHSVGSLLALELLHRDLLPFSVDAVVFAGCPAPAYAALAPDDQPALATIRNLRNRIRFINVFHPLDPVAYRLEPFVLPDGERLPPAVKVAPRRRSFWRDAELFWDDVVYNLWSTLFPQRGGNAITDGIGSGDDDDSRGNVSEKGNAMVDLFSTFGGNTRGKSHLDGAGDRTRRRQMRRSSSYLLSSATGKEGEEQGVAEEDAAGGEVLLSGRIDYELQDGMGMPPLDVMASWGAIKAHTYYWQSVDIAQMLLDIVMTSDDAMASREAEEKLHEVG